MQFLALPLNPLANFRTLSLCMSRKVEIYECVEYIVDGGTGDTQA